MEEVDKANSSQKLKYFRVTSIKRVSQSPSIAGPLAIGGAEGRSLLPLFPITFSAGLFFWVVFEVLCPVRGSPAQICRFPLLWSRGEQVPVHETTWYLVHLPLKTDVPSTNTCTNLYVTCAVFCLLNLLIPSSIPNSPVEISGPPICPVLLPWAWKVV
jgi:hypothetical protein